MSPAPHAWTLQAFANMACRVRHDKDVACKIGDHFVVIALPYLSLRSGFRTVVPVCQPHWCHPRRRHLASMAFPVRYDRDIVWGRYHCKVVLESHRIMRSGLRTVIANLSKEKRTFNMFLGHFDRSSTLPGFHVVKAQRVKWLRILASGPE